MTQTLVLVLAQSDTGNKHTQKAICLPESIFWDTNSLVSLAYTACKRSKLSSVSDQKLNSASDQKLDGGNLEG